MASEAAASPGENLTAEPKNPKVDSDREATLEGEPDECRTQLEDAGQARDEAVAQKQEADRLLTEAAHALDEALAQKQESDLQLTRANQARDEAIANNVQLHRQLTQANKDMDRLQRENASLATRLREAQDSSTPSGAMAATSGEATPVCTVTLLEEYARLEDSQRVATSRCIRLMTGQRRGITRPITELPKWKVVPGEIDVVGQLAIHDQFVYFCVKIASGALVIKRIHLDSLASGHWEDFPAPVGKIQRIRGFFSFRAHLYVLLASDSSEPLRLYKHSAERWSHVTDMPLLSKVTSFGIIGTRLVVAGGRDADDQFLKTCHAFDLTDESQPWEKLPDAPVPFSSGLCISQGTRMHVIGRGGYYRDKPKTILTLAASGDDAGRIRWAWSSRVLPETPLYDCGACLVNDTLVVAGGVSYSFLPGTWYEVKNKVSSSVYMLDAERNEWTPLPSLVHNRSVPYLLFNGKKIICFGGLAEDLKTWRKTIETLELV